MHNRFINKRRKKEILGWEKYGIGQVGSGIN